MGFFPVCLLWDLLTPGFFVTTQTRLVFASRIFLFRKLYWRNRTQLSAACFDSQAQSPGFLSGRNLKASWLSFVSSMESPDSIEAWIRQAESKSRFRNYLRSLVICSNYFFDRDESPSWATLLNLSLSDNCVLGRFNDLWHSTELDFFGRLQISVKVSTTWFQFFAFPLGSRPRNLLFLGRLIRIFQSLFFRVEVGRQFCSGEFDGRQHGTFSREGHTYPRQATQLPKWKSDSLSMAAWYGVPEL